MATPHTVPPSHCTAATPVSFPRPGLTHLSLPQGLCACSSPSLELCLSPDLPRTRSSSSPRSPPKRHGQGVNPCPRKPPVFPSCRVTFCNVTLFCVTLDMSKRTVCVFYCLPTGSRMYAAQGQACSLSGLTDAPNQRLNKNTGSGPRKAPFQVVLLM